MQPNLSKSSCVWSLQHLSHQIGRKKTWSLTWMSPAKELHICTRYLVVAMLLTLKQNLFVCIQNINYLSIKTWGLQWRLQISQLFPGSFTQPWHLHDWVVLANCRPSTPLVITLSLCLLLHDQSTTNPEVWQYLQIRSASWNWVHPYSIPNSLHFISLMTCFLLGSFTLFVWR
jgi:hypothetical protein